MPLPDAVPHEETNVRNLVNKFKSQRAKRTREKNQRELKSDEKSANKRRSQAIDKWQREQQNVYKKQREHELFVQDAKKTLFEIRGRKHLFKDRIKLIVSLEKLREVRRKQLINVQSRFPSSEVAKSNRDFSEGISPLKEKLESALTGAVKEEETLVLTMKGGINHDHPIGKDQNKVEGSGAEIMKLKRDKKWQKYLHKKSLKMQNCQ